MKIGDQTKTSSRLKYLATITMAGQVKNGSIFARSINSRPSCCARLDLCKAKGFDAVEPDNMEIYTNDTGFPLTYEDQLKFALWLADEAHKRGLAIGVEKCIRSS